MDQSNEVVVTIELSLPQAQAVSTALELLTRLGLGQFPFVAELMPAVVVPRGSDDLSFEQQLAVRNQLTVLLGECAKVLGHPERGSFGITHPQLPIMVRRGYEVNCVLEQAVLQHTQPSPKFHGPKYDGLRLRVTTDQAPRAAVEAKA